MPRLTVIHQEETHLIDYQAGLCLRDILEEAGCRVRTACIGHGACGLCQVWFPPGSPNLLIEPTIAEQLHLSPEELAEGVRLACQQRPVEDLNLRVIKPAPASQWRRLPVERLEQEFRHLPEGEAGVGYGIAVDLGTTHIRVALIGLKSGRWLCEYTGPNPQATLGADVMTRLSFAAASLLRAEELGNQPRAAIGECLAELAQRDGIELGKVTALGVVGNTAMLALLSHRGYRELLEPRHWQSPIDCTPDREEVAQWVADWGISPKARVELFQPLAGFVGSDLWAGLIACQFTEGASPALFMDLGTNSELALWDGATLWVTSAAGGPAFESSGFSCGMPAETGAIYRVGWDREGLESDPRVSVIGNGTPQGVCGSGLVDLVARLLERGILGERGRFTDPALRGRFRLAVEADHPLYLTERDIDQLQQAKGAIGAGIRVLAREAGVPLSELRRICVSGEFGLFLSVDSAIRVGLLPPAPQAAVEMIGDTALYGCAHLLLSGDAEGQREALFRRVQVVNMALAEDFESLYLDGLFLRPMNLSEVGVDT